VQFGALSRKSRPAKSLADPLGEVSKRLNGVIEEFGKFCEYVFAPVLVWHYTNLYLLRAYYETKATGSRFSEKLSNVYF